MKYFIITGLTLCVGATVGTAEPLRLSSAEVDQITASGFASALVARDDKVKVLIRVMRDGQTLIDRQFVHSVPSLPAGLGRPLDRMGEKAAHDVLGSLPRVDLPDVRPIDAAAIDVPRPAAAARPSLEAARAVDLVRAAVAHTAIGPAKPADFARPATAFQAADLGRFIEATLGQVQRSSTPAATSGMTVQRTSIVAHSAGGLASAAARNVNVTR